MLLDTEQLRTELVAGSIGGSLGIFIGFPFDLVKVKLQSHPTLYTSAWQCFVQTLKEGGIRGLYTGCLPPIMTQGVVQSLTFVGESVARNALDPEAVREDLPLSTINQYAAGCFGGLVQCFALVPADVVKCE